MRVSWFVALCGWLCVSQVAVAQLPIPEGTWAFNGDGYAGKLVLKVGKEGKVTGTVYGDRIVGWYDGKTKRLNFVRMGDPKASSFQAYKGCLFSNPDGKKVLYTLAGTFIPSDADGSADHVPEMGWYAQIIVEKPPVGASAKKKAVAALVEVGVLPKGTWKFNGDGYKGDLILKIDGGKVTGTVYGNPITGSFDASTKRLNFLRLCDPKDPASFQAHTGYLFANQEGKKTRYTLAGTFFNIGNTAEMGWYARILVADPPVSGKTSPGVEVLDALMLKCLRKIGCTGATLTVARGKQTLYSRGYGWSDKNRKVPMLSDTPMSIASCDKPFTAAAIRQLARNGKLDLNASVLKVLDIKPAGKVLDKRVWDITINHLLDHKAGWQGEPTERAWQAANGKKYPIAAETLLRYVMVQKLAWKPGEKGEYDSFGYNTLKRVVARVSGRTYIDYLRHHLCRPSGVKELHWVRHGARRKGEPEQLWNGLIMEDPADYRMGVSTPALCTFMRCFWIDGKPRDKGNPLWIMGGSWDNSTTEMIWRSDGINVAWSFNGRAGVNPGNELWEKAIDQLIKDKRLPK